MSEQAAPAVEPTQPAAPADNTEPASPEKQNTPQVDDDPELDFGDLKVKKSEAAKRLKQQKELERGARQKFEEAAKMRKEVDAFVGGLKKDTLNALKASGLSRAEIVKLAETVLSEEIADAQLTPEEKEVREIKAERDRLKAEREESEKQRQAQAEAQEVAQYEQQFDQAFAQAIKAQGLDHDEDTVFRMASKVESYWGKGIQISIDEIAQEIAEEDDARWQKRIGSWDAATLAKRLGVRIEDVRKHLLSQTPSGQRPAPSQDDQPAPKNRDRKPLTEQELKKLVKQRIG